MEKALRASMTMMAAGGRGFGLLDRGLWRLSRVVAWLGGPTNPSIDLFFGLLAAGWAGLMLLKPELFGRGSLVALAWISDVFWISALLTAATLHVVGLLRPWWGYIRAAACLLSGWLWLFVSGSLLTNEFGTGVWTYGLLGLFALGAALHVAWARPGA